MKEAELWRDVMSNLRFPIVMVHVLRVFTI